MSDKTPAGAARIVKTKRVQYAITANDVSSGFTSIDVVWDSPFLDLNYTADQNVEVIAPADPSVYSVLGFTRDVNKVTVVIANDGAAGDVVVIHAHAEHD
jgi:hypothetical protein